MFYSGLLDRTQSGVRTLLFWSFVLKVQQISLLPTPGSRFLIPLELCRLEKNGKELAHLRRRAGGFRDVGV